MNEKASSVEFYSLRGNLVLIEKSWKYKIIPYLHKVIGTFRELDQALCTFGGSNPAMKRQLGHTALNKYLNDANRHVKPRHMETLTYLLL